MPVPRGGRRRSEGPSRRARSRWHREHSTYRAGRTDEREEVCACEVHVDRVTECGEPSATRRERTHQHRSPRRGALRRAGPVVRLQSPVSRGRQQRVRVEYGQRGELRCRRRSVGPRSRTSTTRVTKQLADIVSEASRPGPSTNTRKKSSPVAPASSRSWSTLPRSVRSFRPPATTELSQLPRWLAGRLDNQDVGGLIVTEVDLERRTRGTRSERRRRTAGSGAHGRARRSARAAGNAARQPVVHVGLC